ncbi:hypothetical protein [Halomarina litorea]|uniref:hypothetical protein n=1 Tax=Halomarina litorea TaxID=2961595 RepID=UPI0020C4F164|nr:hypothetical protein [Halomarina sp. BCD28]
MADRRPSALVLTLASVLGMALLVAVLVPRHLLVDPRFSTALLARVTGALAVVGLYALAPPVYAAGVGLAVAAVLVAPATLTEVGLAVLGATLVLARDATSTPRPAVAALALLSAGAVMLTTAALASFAFAALWQAALALVAAGATLVYGVHRYERVRMGLVSDT